MYPMGRESEGMLSPTRHYYEIRGRAAEIARAVGSPVGGDGRTWMHVFGPDGSLGREVTRGAKHRPRQPGPLPFGINSRDLRAVAFLRPGPRCYLRVTWRREAA